MPKQSVESNNNLGLDESLIGIWESLVKSAEEKGLANRQELENIYNQTWEKTDSQLSRSVREFGRDSVDAQESVILKVRLYLDRMINRPVYNVYYRKENFSKKVMKEKDENGVQIEGTEYPGSLTFGIGVLENTKTGIRYKPKFIRITGYRQNAKKLDALEETGFVKVQAIGPKTPGEMSYIELNVDDRCNGAEAITDKNVEVPTFDDFMSNNFDITTVAQVKDRLSQGKGDWRLLQGLISFGPVFPANKGYAKFEITDLSTPIGEKVNNVQVYADRDLVQKTGAGVGSKVQVLGSVSKSTDPRYNNITMWWPQVIKPLFKVEMDEKQKPQTQKSDEEAIDTNEYLNLRERLAREKKQTDVMSNGDSENSESEQTKEEVSEDVQEGDIVKSNVTTPDIEMNGEVIDKEALKEAVKILKTNETIETDNTNALSDAQIEQGESVCIDFGKYNPKDDACKSCISDPQYEELSKNCKKYTEYKKDMSE